MKIILTASLGVLLFITGISSVTYEAPCNDAKKCDKGLVCHIELEGCKNGKCMCPKTHIWEDKKCKKVVEKDAACSGDNKCNDKVKLECGKTSKKCECPTNRVWNDKVKKCIGKGLAILEEKCDGTKKQCYASECVNGKCGCVAGTKFGMECRLPRKGETCKAHLQCDGTDVVCNDKKVCSCKLADEVYVASNKTCKVAGKKVQGNSCKADSDCAGELLCRQCMKIDGKLDKKMCVGHKPQDENDCNVVLPSIVVVFASVVSLLFV